MLSRPLDASSWRAFLSQVEGDDNLTEPTDNRKPFLLSLFCPTVNPQATSFQAASLNCFVVPLHAFWVILTFLKRFHTFKEKD